MFSRIWSDHDLSLTVSTQVVRNVTTLRNPIRVVLKREFYFLTMSSKLEAGADREQSARPLVVPSPVPSPVSKTASVVGDNGLHVATDKPYSVFTYNEKWLIVSLASCAAIFR